MVTWMNLCRGPSSNRLNPALQQYYAEETEEFFTNLANGLDNLLVSLGSEFVRVEWLEHAVSFLRTTHSEMHVLLDKLMHYGPAHSHSKPDWLVGYMDETSKLLDFCARLKPGIVRIERYQMSVELAFRALSRLNMDAIQADLRRCVYRTQVVVEPKKSPDEDPVPERSVRKRSPPSRQSFEFPAPLGSPAQDTSPVMPSSPLTMLDIGGNWTGGVSLAHMNLLTTPAKPADPRADSLARDTAAIKAQFMALDMEVGGGDDSWDNGMEDLEALVAEAEKLLYIKRPGSMTEPPLPPPGMFDSPLTLPPMRETGSPLRPFKLDSNFKIDVSPSKSSDSSTQSSKRRSMDAKPSPGKPPVYRPAADAKDTKQAGPVLEVDTGSFRHTTQVSNVSGADTESSSATHSRQPSADTEPGSSRRHSGRLAGESNRSGPTVEQLWAPFLAQFEASLNALRECKEEMVKEWSRSAESRKSIEEPPQDFAHASRSGVPVSFGRYFKHRPSMDSSRRKSIGEGSKLAQFLETLTAEKDSDEDEAREGRDSSDGLSTISASAWVEKGTHSVTRIAEEEEQSSKRVNVRDVKKVLSNTHKGSADGPVVNPPKKKEAKISWSNQPISASHNANHSRWVHLYSDADSEPVVPTKAHDQVGHASPGSPTAKRENEELAPLFVFGEKQHTTRRTSGRRRSQSLDEVASQRLNLDNYLVTEVHQSREASPMLKSLTPEDLANPLGVSDNRGSIKRSASFDRWQPFTPGGWKSERTEAIVRAYQSRKQALPPSPDSRLDTDALEGGATGPEDEVAGDAERLVEGSDKGFHEQATIDAGGGGAPALVRRGSSASDELGERSSRDLSWDGSDARSNSQSIDRAPQQYPTSTTTTLRPRPLPEAKHLKPLSARAGSQNVARIVARFESFFDAEFDAKHDIKTAERRSSSRDLVAPEVEPKVRVYDNPLHRTGAPIFSPAAPSLKEERKSTGSLPTRSWKIDGSTGFWRKSASSSPSRYKEHERRGGRRQVASVSPRKSGDRHKSLSAPSPSRLSFFDHVRMWVSHHHHHHHHHHKDDDESSTEDRHSIDLRRSGSWNHSKPGTPLHHTLLRSPGRLNLITLQKGASSFVRHFGSAAIKQCTSPAGASSRWTGLGGVLLATRASTGLVSSFVIWVLARREADIHPSRLLTDYIDTKSEVQGHWASSLRRLQERVANFDSGTRSLFGALSSVADSHRPSSSSENDRRGKKRWSLEKKSRRSSSEHRRQDVDDYRSGESIELDNQGQPVGTEKSGSRRNSVHFNAGASSCLHVQELKDVHHYVGELHVGLEALFSCCLSALGKSRTQEQEQLPQEKIIREYVPSESSSESAIARRLFDKGHMDATPSHQGTSIPMHHKSTNAQVSKGRKKPDSSDGTALSPDSPSSGRKSSRRNSGQTAVHHVSHSSSSFSFEMDNTVEQQLRLVEASFEEWRSGKMAVMMRRLEQCKDELRVSMETVSREVDELLTELENGRRSMVDLSPG